MFDPTVAHLVEDAMVFGVVIVLVIAASVLGMARAKARRQTQGDVDVIVRLDEIVARLNHLETAVDASALEIERISEGQRFTTRLLAERNAKETPSI